MITITMQNKAAIEYLERDKYTNLNTLGFLSNSDEAEIYLYNGGTENGVIVGDKEQDFFFLNTHDTGFLREFWEIIPPGHKCFSGVQEPIARIFMADKKAVWQNPCKVFALKGEFKRPEDTLYTVESLTLADAEEVDRYYTYRSEESLDRIRENIARFDSTCIRVNGQLASWSTVHTEDRSMGPLYTKEEYRGQGMAEAVSSRLMEKLIAKHIIPYVQIIKHNNASLHLAGRLKGLEYSHDCIWFGIDK